MDAVKTNIDDQILEKRMKKRKIVNLSIIIVSTLFAIVLILMSTCIKVDLRPNFFKSPDWAELHSPEIVQSHLSFNEDSAEIKEFNQNLDKVFGITSLNAIFTGNFGNYIWYESSRSFVNPSSISGLGSSYADIHYNEDQVFLNKDGSERKSQLYSSRTLKYNRVIFKLDNEDVVKDVTFYFVTKGSLGDENALGIAEVTLKCNLHEIYKMLGI